MLPLLTAIDVNKEVFQHNYASPETNEIKIKTNKIVDI